MRKVFCLTVALALIGAGMSCAVVVQWSQLPTPDWPSAGGYYHTGTDGNNLYMITAGQGLFRLDQWYVDEFFAVWTPLATPPRTVCSGDTTSGLEYQSGYLYTLALASQGGRTVMRYSLATDTWEVWQDADGQDVVGLNATCALRMDPLFPGVGYGMWHAGNLWCRFDWDHQTIDNAWLGTVNGWGSRNESSALDVATNRYYATEQSWGAGLQADDRIYTWVGTAKGAPRSHFVQKPFECGFGQAVSFVEGEISPSGDDELWLIRARGDFSAGGSKNEGTGAPTSDWSRYDFATGLWSTEEMLPDVVDGGGSITRVGGNMFIKSQSYVLVAAIGTPPDHPSVAIGTVKALADETPVTVRGVGTAAFTDSTLDPAPRYYLESADRSSAIQTRFGSVGSDPAPAMGMPLVVSGALKTDLSTGERYVAASDWWVTGLSSPVTPLSMNTRILTSPSGLSTLGLVAKVAGTIKSVSPDSKFIYISDGSITPEADGLRIDLSYVNSADLPSLRAGNFVIACGISAKYSGSGGQKYPVVRVRTADDLTKVQTVPPTETWTTVTGPISDVWSSWCAVGTDGDSLYVMHRQESVGHNGRFYKYSFETDPTAGTWTPMPDSDPIPDAPGNPYVWITVPWANAVSNERLAYQNGYLYARGTVQTLNGWQSCMTRYNILDGTWENWTNPDGSFITSSNSSGCALVMDPEVPGRGVSVWHAGGWWVEFDWNAQTTDNQWISPYYNLYSEGVSSAGWVSRNEDIATDGAGTYYATHNDWIDGLSAGDVIYSFSGLHKQDRAAGVTICHNVTQKPWQAGAGQSLQFVPRTLTLTGHDELWVIRGTNGTNPNEGFGTPTADYGRYDLVTGQWVAIGTLPGNVGYTGKIVLVKGSIFVRGVDNKWYVTKLN